MSSTWRATVTSNGRLPSLWNYSTCDAKQSTLYTCNEDNKWHQRLAGRSHSILQQWDVITTGHRGRGMWCGSLKIMHLICNSHQGYSSGLLSPNPVFSSAEPDNKICWTRYKYCQFWLKSRFCSTLPRKLALSFKSIHLPFWTKWWLCASAWCWLVSVARQSFCYRKSGKTPQTQPLPFIWIPPGLLLSIWASMSMGWIFHGNINRVQLAVFWSWRFMHLSSQFSCLSGICDLNKFRGGKPRQWFTLKAKLNDHLHRYKFTHTLDAVWYSTDSHKQRNTRHAGQKLGLYSGWPSTASGSSHVVQQMWTSAQNTFQTDKETRGTGKLPCTTWLWQALSVKALTSEWMQSSKTSLSMQ